MTQLRLVLVALLVVITLAIGTRVSAQGWSCDEPPAWMVEACEQGNCGYLWIWWSWRADNCE
jgi:hypothetical protein